MLFKISKYLNNLNGRQVLILAGVAASLMFVAIFLFLNFYTSREVEHIKELSADEKPASLMVVVAKSDISPRTKIREEMLELKEIPQNDLPSGAITDKAEIIDLPAKITILAGDVITSRKLYKNSSQSGFVGTIPPDCRAISIHVNDVTGVAGFAKPGDYVDLLLVENDSTSATTNVILQNVLLLSINQTMDRDEVEKEGDGKAAIDTPSIVTVAVRPHEALKLVSASKLGDIYLMLRPARPLETYVEGLEYKVISANVTVPQENPPLAVQDEPVSSESLPEPEKPKAVIEIIHGDRLVTPESTEKSEGK